MKLLLRAASSSSTDIHVEYRSRCLLQPLTNIVMDIKRSSIVVSIVTIVSSSYIHTYIYKFLIRGINGRSDNRETIKRNFLVNRGREGWFRDTSSLAMQKYVTRIKDQIKTGKLVIAKCIQCYTKYRICEIADVNIHYAVISRIAITLEKWNDSTFAYWSCANDACAVSCPCLCASENI